MAKIHRVTPVEEEVRSPLRQQAVSFTPVDFGCRHLGELHPFNNFATPESDAVSSDLSNLPSWQM